MEIRKDGDQVRVKSWATDIEENTMQQALRSARSDAVSGPIALMPDAHWGLGATVGSVIPTKSAIIPAAVGVDIGCGMIAVETKLDANKLGDNLQPVLDGIAKAVPSGFASHDEVSSAASKWITNNPLRTEVELRTKQYRKIGTQLGTLGGGNHFVEVCLDENETVWVVLHSGSRGIGNILAQSHIREAKSLCRDLERALDDKDLAYFLEQDAQFDAYISDMLWAQRYALENREQMMNNVLFALRSIIGQPVQEKRRINCHHNYTQQETHDDQRYWITRKGAIKADVGDLGVIPGSMGTNSYIVSGLGNPDSYTSASHGAGRRFGRKEAKRRFNTKEFTEAMKGRVWQQSKQHALLDESPMAYKDIDEVMTNQADLVKVEHTLHAIVNYKGTS